MPVPPALTPPAGPTPQPFNPFGVTAQTPFGSPPPTQPNSPAGLGAGLPTPPSWHGNNPLLRPTPTGSPPAFTLGSNPVPPPPGPQPIQNYQQFQLSQAQGDTGPQIPGWSQAINSATASAASELGAARNAAAGWLGGGTGVRVRGSLGGMNPIRMAWQQVIRDPHEVTRGEAVGAVAPVLAPAAAQGAGRLLQAGGRAMPAVRPAVPAAAAAATRSHIPLELTTPLAASATVASQAAPAVAAAAPAAAAASGWRGLLGAGGRALNTATKYDPVTGIGAIRNTAELLGRTGASMTGFSGAPGSMVGRTLVTSAVPPVAFGVNQQLNNPGETPDQAATARQGDVTRRLVDPDALGDTFTRPFQRLGDMAGAVGNTVPTWAGGNDKPGLGAMLGRGADTVSGIGSSLVRDRNQVAEVARRQAGLAGDALQGSEAGRLLGAGPSQNDQYRALAGRYADAVRGYNQTGDGPAWEQAARGIQDEARALNYPTPNGMGAGPAQQAVLGRELANRLRSTADPRTAPFVDAEVARRENFRLHPPAGELPDPSRPLRFPTGGDITRAEEGYGFSPNLSPETAAVRRQMLDRDLAPQEAETRRVLQEQAYPRLTKLAPQELQRNPLRSDRLERDLADISDTHRLDNPVEGAEALSLASRVQQGNPRVPAAAGNDPALRQMISDENLYLGRDLPEIETPAGGPSQPPTVPGPTPQQAMGPTGGGQFPEIPQLDQAPPPVRQELGSAGPAAAERIAQTAGVDPTQLATAAGAGAAIAATQAAAPPPGFGAYWKELPPASKTLAIAGLSLAAISFLRSTFSSGDDDEPGFLMRVLPYLGMGAAAWGLGGGTLWGDQGVSMPQGRHYSALGSAIRSNLPFGAGPG